MAMLNNQRVLPAEIAKIAIRSACDPLQDFMTMEAPITQVCGSRVLPMAWGGSYWHHDIRDKEAGSMM